jgi:hypothetical protein
MGGRRGGGEGRQWRSVLLYGLLLLGVILGFLLIRHQGRALVAPPPSDPAVFGAAGVSGEVDVLLHVLLALVLFLPAFFAFTGLRTQIGLISGLANWLVCGLIIAVASAGKFGGSFLAARLTGLTVRESAAVGILLNTRGLMELIVLNIGLDLRILSPVLFAMMVIMAVVTTLATSPIIRLLGADKTAGERIDSDSAVRV